MRRRRLVIIGLGTVAAAVVAGAVLVATAGPDPLEIVHGWTTSRNAGDVDTAMSYLTDAATVFGFSIADPLRATERPGDPRRPGYRGLDDPGF